MDDFKPIFNFFVYVNNPSGSRNRVNPEHCLYPNSAWELAKILSANGFPCSIIPGPANHAWGGLPGIGFSESEQVPWLQFDGANGERVQERAGEIAAYWIHATNNDTGVTDQPTALRNAIADVKNLIAGN